MNDTKWYLLGISGHYHFWFRNPFSKEDMMVYQCTPNAASPDNEAGYGNLESLMKLKGVTEIVPPGHKGVLF